MSPIRPVAASNLAKCPPITWDLHLILLYNPRLDEILQLILNELDDPTNFSLASKSIYAFTQDPYVRASYFIARYGKIQAFFWALGRGKLMDKPTIDVCLVLFSFNLVHFFFFV